MSSARHSICKGCVHAANDNNQYHKDGWCYLFRDGGFLVQGYCAQFRLSPDVPNTESTAMEATNE